MAWCDCTTTEKLPKISLRDPHSKRSAIFINKDKLKIEKTQWDKCVVCEKTAADWVLTCAKNGQVIVELKGKDTSHGAEQILASAAELKTQGKLSGKIAGLVVGSQYPKFDSKIRRAKQEFMRSYGGLLHVACSAREFEIAKLISG